VNTTLTSVTLLLFIVLVLIISVYVWQAIDRHHMRQAIRETNAQMGRPTPAPPRPPIFNPPTRREPVSNFQRTADWLAACGKTPAPETLSLQIGCDLEETAELLRCLRVSKDGWARLLERLVIDLESLGAELKRGQLVAHFPTHLRTEALDALCDREVTGNGVAFLAGFDKPGADAAVLASNDAKLVDGQPVILPGGKIGKPAGWQAPNLKPFV
jgi:hypothetical protein